MPKFHRTQQLDLLIKRFPKDPVDIHGILLDYIGKTGKNLDEVLDLNPKIYRQVFLKDEQKDELAALVDTLVQTDAAKERLQKRCENIYPTISKLLAKPTNEPLAQASFPEDYAPDPEDIVIWQISDIHFGKFHALEDDPVQLAAILAQVASDFPAFKPHLIVLTGDLASEAAASELGKGLKFCEQLSKDIWSEVRPQRFLVIPGNHDTSWKTNGTADKMARFQKIFAEQEVVLTPFHHLESAQFEDGAVELCTISGDEPDSPPYARVAYKRYSLDLLLLVSGYYSGFVPEAIRTALKSHKDLHDILFDLLREDKGDISHRYILNLLKLERPVNATGIAAIHHNLCPFGNVPCNNRLAPKLLRTLYGKGFEIVLHGHIHMAETGSERPGIPDSSFPIPCPTLNSSPTHGNRGFLIHILGPYKKRREMKTILWEVSSLSDFAKEGRSLLRSFDLPLTFK